MDKFAAIITSKPAQYITLTICAIVLIDYVTNKAVEHNLILPKK